MIDACTAMKWYLPEVHADRAAGILLRQRNQELVFHVPGLFYCEAGSILWKKIRRGEMREAEAQALVRLLVAVPKVVHHSAELLPEALRIAARSARSAYDCMYVALANILNCPLVTADDKLVNALKRSPWGRLVRSLADFR